MLQEVQEETPNEPPPTKNGNQNTNQHKKPTGKKRRHRKRNRKNTEITIATINIRGAKGKIRSLESLLASEKVKIAAITETMFSGNEGYNIKGYTWIGKNRKDRKGGGIGILVSNCLSKHIREEDSVEDSEDNEILWITLNTRPTPIAIGTFYGPQESEKIDKVINCYNNLETQINQMKQKAEIFLTGDFNAKLKIANRLGTQNESRNGKYLQEVMERTNLIPSSVQAQNGLWTRVNRKNISEKSVIDYVLTTSPINDSIITIIIDEEGALRIKGKNQTDHNTIMTNIKTNTPRQPAYNEVWKLSNQSGWQKFNKEIQKTATQENIADGDYSTAEKKIREILTRTVGKIKIRTDKAPKVKSDELTNAKMERKMAKKEFEEACKGKDGEKKRTSLTKYTATQQKVRNIMEQADREKTEQRIENLIQMTKINPNQIWQARRRAKRSSELDYNIITEDDKTITDPDEEKEYIANFFEQLYQARPSTPDYEQISREISQSVATTSNNYLNNEETQGSEPITLKETNDAIKRLRRRKSVGPDDLPNEIFIEADGKTKQIYNDILNKIHRETKIPEEWKIGHVKRLYKGKGKKGKCSNERGITLASNFGKLYERIINNRIKQELAITNKQAGGMEGSATVDHLITLKQAIHTIRKKGKTAYIIFLDVQKAYDKAWLDAILYVLEKNGIKGKNLKILKELNTNLKARIMTKHGLTREINIKDSIRQGGVLSVIEYASLIDEIAKELESNNMGIMLDNNVKLGCLLWMDDVVLIHEDREEIKKMMDCTNHVALKYHIEFGAPKCKIIKIGKGQKTEAKIGNTQLEETLTYKYLGEIINNKANLKHHLEETRNKVNAATQTIIFETGNKEFKGMRMRAIWELVDTTIIPILLYAAEGWKLRQEDSKHIQITFNKAIKEILRLPQSTPTNILLAEIGYVPIEMIIKKKKIMCARRIEKKDNASLIKQVTEIQNSPWNEEIEELAQEYDIDQNQDMSKNMLRNHIDLMNKAKFLQILNEEAKTKSKTQNWIEHRTPLNLGKRPKHLDSMSRKQCSALIKARTRMLPVKENYPGTNTRDECRFCKSTEERETQLHILQECPTIKEKVGSITYRSIYEDTDMTNMKKTTDHILKVSELLEKPPDA